VLAVAPAITTETVPVELIVQTFPAASVIAAVDPAMTTVLLGEAAAMAALANRLSTIPARSFIVITLVARLALQTPSSPFHLEPQIPLVVIERRSAGGV
jgi:hypothetical protein